MQSKKAIMTSRREFVSNALGIALVTALTWQARADQAHSIHEQSDNRTSNSGSTTQNRSLRWDVFLSPSIPAIASDLAPGEKERPWPPISSTLISGERDAVLVDTPITVEQARALANWIGASGKNLTTVYATHGHGDHFFGTSTVLERFPGARFVARPEVIKLMRQQASPEVTLSQIKQPLFALGRLVATPGALELLTRAEQTPLEFLARHSRGDWGDCGPEDATENDFSVKAGFESSASIAHAMAKSFG